MKKELQFGLMLLLICMGNCQNVFARKIHNRHFKFTITVPDQAVEIRDSTDLQGECYYDTAASIILMISVIEKNKFKSVNDYMDCTREGLEQQLRQEYGDTTLTLISCNKPLYYPGKTTLLHFSVAGLPSGHNTYMIYFIHHRHKDIQISFTYKNGTEQYSQNYINKVMQTLVLE